MNTPTPTTMNAIASSNKLGDRMINNNLTVRARVQIIVMQGANVG